jgi:cell division protein FtsW
LTTLRTNLFLVALALSMLGLVMVYSATYRDYGTSYLIVRAGHMVLGVMAFFAASRIRYTAWRKFGPVFFVAVLASLVLVLIPGIGVEIGGSRRWFDLGFFMIQPAEFAKIAAVVVASLWVARLRPGSGLPLGLVGVIGVLFGLVVLEPDFGTSVMILAGAAGVLWASELRTRDLLLFGGAGLTLLAGVMLLAPYRRERFLTFLDPWSVSQSSGYQVVQSMTAIQSGDWFGAGAGAGAEGTYVPELRTDMIFALIGEELGLLGMVLVIAAFVFLALAGLRISLHAPSVLGRCMAAGLTTTITAQAIFNIGAAMGVLPLAGMTLPFVSYGGSSMLVCFVAVGILYRISEDSERAREVKPRAAKARAAADLDRRRRDRGTRDPRALRGG